MIYLSGPLACKLAFLPFFNEYGSFDLFMSDLREHSLAIPRVIWLFSPNGDMMVKCSSKKKPTLESAGWEGLQSLLICYKSISFDGEPL